MQHDLGRNMVRKKMVRNQTVRERRNSCGEGWVGGRMQRTSAGDEQEGEDRNKRLEVEDTGIME